MTHLTTLLWTLCCVLMAAPGAKAAQSTWVSHAQPQQGVYAPGRLLIKFKTRLDGSHKANPQLQSLLGSALQSAQPLVRRATTGEAAGVDRIVSVQVDDGTDIPMLAHKLSA